MLEGGITTSSVLFEKYQVTDIIYESDTVTVYSAEHMFMSAKRIIKKILKKSLCRESFYSEVNILKNIRHPNIPIVYDVEEDNSAYYIIEEYMAGLTLDAYMKEHSVMSQREVIDIGIKICDIVSFLHETKPIPILFLDVHPGNILIDDNNICLVDFGNSYYSDDAEKRKLLMGTVGYAAPEQYEYGKLDERTDIYGIGAVLNFLAPEGISEQFKIIISRCLATDRNDRFQSVSILAKNLKKINETNEFVEPIKKVQEDNIHVDDEKPRIISFAGVDRRMGVTHISLAFAAYLSEQGYRVLYEEANESNHLRAIVSHKKLKYNNGLFEHNRLMLKPLYGMQINLEVDCDYIVRDIGLFDEKICDAHSTVVIVAGAKGWELETSAATCRRAIDKMNSNETKGKIYILSNGGNEHDNLLLWKKVGYMGMTTPVLGDVFEHNDIQKKFFYELENMITPQKDGGEVHKKKEWIFRKIAKKATNGRRRHMGRS